MTKPVASSSTCARKGPARFAPSGAEGSQFPRGVTRRASRSPFRSVALKWVLATCASPVSSVESDENPQMIRCHLRCLLFSRTLGGGWAAYPSYFIVFGAVLMM